MTTVFQIVYKNDDGTEFAWRLFASRESAEAFIEKIPESAKELLGVKEVYAQEMTIHQ